MIDVQPYSIGLVYLSACCSLTEDYPALEAAVNANCPTMISSQWRVADKPFVTGEPNPCPCEREPNRMHVLFSC